MQPNASIYMGQGFGQATFVAGEPIMPTGFVFEGVRFFESTNMPNAITAWLTLEPFEEREDPSESAEGILTHLYTELGQIQEAIAFAFPPPAILGLGNAGGFQMEVQDQGGLGYTALAQVTEEMVRDGEAQSGLTGLSTTFRASASWTWIEPRPSG